MLDHNAQFVQCKLKRVLPDINPLFTHSYPIFTQFSQHLLNFPQYLPNFPHIYPMLTQYLPFFPFSGNAFTSLITTASSLGAALAGHNHLNIVICFSVYLYLYIFFICICVIVFTFQMLDHHCFFLGGCMISSYEILFNHAGHTWLYLVMVIIG